MTKEHQNQCLLVLDMQRGFVNEHTEHLPSAITRLCEAHHFGDRLFTAFVNPNDNSLFETVLNWHRFKELHEFGITESLSSLSTFVAYKYAYSPFVYPCRLEDKLLEISPLKVIVVGVDTDACVLATVCGLWDRNYEPVVLTDLVASTGGPEAHQAGLTVLRRMIGNRNVLTSRDWLQQQTT